MSLQQRIEDRLDKLSLDPGDLLVFQGGNLPQESFEYIQEWALRHGLDDLLIVCIPEGQTLEAIDRDDLRERLGL